MKFKKGIAIQFNWIFILVIGALILIFFFAIINKQRTFSEQSLDKETLEYFDNIISGTNIKIGTVENTSLGSFALELSPDFIKIAGSTWEGIPLRNRIVFSPNLIKGDKLISYADYWSIPYKVDYFIYLTSNEVRYIIIDDVSTEEDRVYINQLLDLLPKFITKEVLGHTSISTMQDKNNYKTRFIFINFNPSGLSSFGELTKKDFSAINIITGDNTLNTKGTIEFYKKANDKLVLDEASFYLKKETLLGAIYSENHDFYSKSLAKALAKLNVVSTIYKNNTESLKEYSNADFNLKSYGCPDTYDSILTNLQIILNNDKSITLASFTSIYNANKEINGYNKELILSSCPILY